MTAKRLETAEPAGQHDDLLIGTRPAQGVEHPLNAVVVAVHQCVVENDRCRLTALGQHRFPGIAENAEILGALLSENAYAPSMTFVSTPTAGSLMRLAMTGILRTNQLS
jgi:hypothetical protein